MPETAGEDAVEKQGTGASLSAALSMEQQLSRSGALSTTAEGGSGDVSRSGGMEEGDAEPQPPVTAEDSDMSPPARPRRVFFPLPHFWKTRETTHSSYSNILQIKTVTIVQKGKETLMMKLTMDPRKRN